MASVGFPETSVRNYKSAPSNFPVERIPHLRRGGSLEPRIVLLFNVLRSGGASLLPQSRSAVVCPWQLLSI